MATRTQTPLQEGAQLALVTAVVAAASVLAALRRRVA
jgi:hypothetical protein